MIGPARHPDDPFAAGRPAIPPWSAFVVFAGAVGLGYFASGLALMLVAVLREGASAAGSTEALIRAGNSLGGVLSAVSGIALTEILFVLLALRAFRVPAGEALRLGPSHAGPGVLAAAVFAMLLLSHSLDTLLQLTGLGDQGTLALLKDVFRDASPMRLVIAALVVGFLAGTAEEVLFRGFMQTRLTARWGPVAGVVVTSLCFGLVHFDIAQGSSAVLLGLFLGAITEWSGSLRPAIICHVTNNVLGTLAPALLQSLGAAGVSSATLAVGAAGLIILVPWLRRRLRVGLSPPPAY